MYIDVKFYYDMNYLSLVVTALGLGCVSSSM